MRRVAPSARRAGQEGGGAIPPTLSNPRDLFLQLLGELLWTERILAFEALPELHRQVRSQGLAQAVAEHLEQTREHAVRLEQVFRAVGTEPSSNLSPPVEKLVQHHDELAENVPDGALADVFHAAAGAAVEHHELVSYDALLVLGEALDLGDARDLLRRSRDEEEQALRRLEEEQRRLVGELGR